MKQVTEKCENGKTLKCENGKTLKCENGNPEKCANGKTKKKICEKDNAKYVKVVIIYTKNSENRKITEKSENSNTFWVHEVKCVKMIIFADTIWEYCFVLNMDNINYFD